MAHDTVSGIVQVNVRWLQEHGIVKELLRANLHQKQYVDQVQNVLQKLPSRGSLQQEHLEMLWNLTEKVRCSSSYQGHPCDISPQKKYASSS